MVKMVIPDRNTSTVNDFTLKRTLLFVLIMGFLLSTKANRAMMKVFETNGTKFFYQFSKHDKSFVDATRVCEALGPNFHLVSSLSPEENQFLVHTILRGQHTAWLGMEWTSNGQCEWQDGSPFQWTNWTHGMKNSSTRGMDRQCPIRVSKAQHPILLPSGEWTTCFCPLGRSVICKGSAVGLGQGSKATVLYLSIVARLLYWFLS